MKVVCVGGHLSPLLATIDAFPKNTDILVLGRKYALEGDKALSLEYQEMNLRGIRFVPIVTGRLQRKFTAHTIPSLLKTPAGFIQALSALNEFKPDVLIAFGGYVSIPVVFAAYILKIPIVIHEQTTKAGFANKIIASFVHTVCISWESSREYFPKEKVVLTGNPVRKFPITNPTGTFGFQLPISNEKNPLIYITGGSTGSHQINELMKGCTERLLNDFVVVHQTGDAKEFEDFEALSLFRKGLDKKLQERYMLTKFVEPSDIGAILSKADIAISRSGMNTVCELLYFGVPSLLIPHPFSQNNEQLQNAEMFRELGLGEIEIQNDLTSEKLYNRIIDMNKNIKKYKQVAEKAKQTIKTDAAKSIVEVIYGAFSETKK